MIKKVVGVIYIDAVNDIFDELTIDSAVHLVPILSCISACRRRGSAHRFFLGGSSNLKQEG